MTVNDNYETDSSIQQIDENEKLIEDNKSINRFTIFTSVFLSLTYFYVRGRTNLFGC
ncbi:hypothetical protein I4U23_006626 [Adineta vaga]|nr:hypothetical protein I4U23_006626 [Adineta vaga]